MARPYKNSSEHQELIDFGNAVRSIRSDKGISQESLAELANMSSRGQSN
jgi:ribosome-binding protein aMBF1 (putative translation factor)